MQTLPKNSQKGFSSLVILIVVILVIAFGGYFLWGKLEKLEQAVPISSSMGDDVSLVYLKEVPYLKTGSEVCYEAGYSCLGMSSTRIVDSDDNFYGYITPSCDSQMVLQPSCEDTFDTEYAINNVEYVKSPNSESDVRLSADYFCTMSDKGKQGTFEFAYCVKKEL